MALVNAFCYALQIFYSEEKDWAEHDARLCTLHVLITLHCRATCLPCLHVTGRVISAEGTVCYAIAV